MRVLVIGQGAREHALVQALSKDPAVEAVLAAPGNPGIGTIAELHAVNMKDPGDIARLAEAVQPDLVVIGPEAPLVAGAADAIRSSGIPCFGPSQPAAMLEGSKAFAKEVMAAAQVPTARSYTCTTPEQVAQALDEFGPPYVVKDDALAAGKGVVVTNDRAEAENHAESCQRVVIEEYLDGPEVSLLVITDGSAYRALIPAQDYKRIGDGNTGPNTGGMGAYAPLPWLPEGTVDTVLSTIAQPTLAEMARRGTPFQGVLYIGLAMTSKGPKVVEFNARFGDPETEVVLPLLRSGLGTLLHAAATGDLKDHEALQWYDGYAVGVVVASAGYPEAPQKGAVVTGTDGPGYFHAGTKRAANGDLVTTGGRTLCCTATGATLEEARQAAYELVSKVHLDGARIRTDIADLG